MGAAAVPSPAEGLELGAEADCGNAELEGESERRRCHPGFAIILISLIFMFDSQLPAEARQGGSRRKGREAGGMVLSLTTLLIPREGSFGKFFTL